MVAQKDIPNTATRQHVHLVKQVMQAASSVYTCTLSTGTSKVSILVSHAHLGGSLAELISFARQLACSVCGLRRASRRRRFVGTSRR